ncbi:MULTISPECIES: hemolysin family protein [unclassified Streptomyces]|uniref:hemolysin family protein n=1 Tax=Streptomycetaceae TaxID=2062 RepID=UPI002E794408|nr:MULTISPECIES: hemolysin family protein [unclassified Streptomyces]MED7954909.1 hemolysin family protein [Streptomyces sp. BE303]MEE1827917.1 hemolysin family protein [Streptomyces sp. BE20]
MITAWLLLLAALLLILANGLFVAAEFAFVTVERGAVERSAEAGDAKSGRVSKALRHLSFELSGAQLGITVTSLVVGMLAEPALSVLLKPVLTGVGLPEGAARGTGVIIGMVLATVVQMVIGELVPKNWAISRPLQVARAVAAPHMAFSRVCRPLISVLNGSADRMVRAFGIEPQEELGHARTPAELVSLARHSARAGAIDEESATLFVRTLGLGDLTAESVMTPRIDVAALQHDASAADVLNLTRATGLSRFPVYSDSLDEVTGTVTLKDALAVPSGRRASVRVSDLAVPPLLVPATLPAERLLDQLRRLQPMAIVVDEYGGTAGVVTVEDIVEEIVGEVQDEHDPADTPELLPLPPVDGQPVWAADGRARLDQLEAIGLYAPDGPYETLAGLVTDLLGKLPAPGEQTELPGWRFTVEAVDRHRTSRVRVERTAEHHHFFGDDEDGTR